MKTRPFTWVCARSQWWRVVAIATGFVFLIWLGFSSTSAQSNKPKRITSIQANDTPQGARVTVAADLALADYEAFRRGDRFYVKIPGSDLSTGQPRFRGNGFDEVQVKRSGDSVLLSFKLQPGATARVDQRSNRLDVVFTALNRSNQNTQEPGSYPGGSIASAKGSTVATQDRRTTDASGPVPPNSPAAARSPGQDDVRSRETAGGSANGQSASTTSAASGLQAQGANPSGTSALGESNPSNSASTYPTPASILQSPTQSAGSAASGSPQSTESRALVLNRTSVQNWLQKNWRWLVPVGVVVLVLLFMLGVKLWRPRSRTRRTTRRIKKVAEQHVEQIASEEAPYTSPEFEEGIRPVAVGSVNEPEEDATEITQVPGTSELPLAVASLSSLPEVKEAKVEDVHPNSPADFERTEVELKKLLAGREYDASLIDAPDAATRQLVAAGLITALSSRSFEQHEPARRAFVEYGYFDETTKDLRTADSPAERAAAARKIGVVRDARGIAHLVAALYDTAPEVRRAAVEALGQIGDQTAITPLNELLQRENSRQLPEAVIRHAINSITVTEVKRTSERPALRVVEKSVPSDQPKKSNQEFESFAQALRRDIEAQVESLASVTPSVPVAPPVEAEPPVSSTAEPPPVVPTLESKLTQEELQLELEEQALRRAAEELEKRRLEIEAARSRTEEDMRLKIEREAQARVEIEARIRAEEEARLRAEEEALLRAVEEERLRKLEEERRLRAEQEARVRAEAQVRAEIEARIRAEEEARRNSEEEQRQRRLEEEVRARVEEQARIRAEEDARFHLEAETLRRAAEQLARKRAEAESARKKAEEEMRVRAEEEARQRIEEEARRKAEDELRRQVELEMRIRIETEARQKAEEESRRVEGERIRAEAAALLLAEETRRRAEDEARQRAADEARRVAEEESKRVSEQGFLRSSQAEGLLREAEERRRAEEEQYRLEQEELLRAADEVARRRRDIEAARTKTEEEAQLLAAAQQRIRAEEEARRNAQAERQRIEAEARHRAEEERKRFEEARQRAIEEQKRAEEDARRKAHEEAQLLAAAQERIRAEEESRLVAIAEQKRLEEVARQKAEESARLLAAAQERILAEEKARKLAEEEQLRLEAEARARAEEEARRFEATLQRVTAEQKRVEEEVRQQAEEEQRRLAELERLKSQAVQQLRLREEQEQRIREEIESLQKAEEEQRQRIEAETRRRAEAEARLREEKARRDAEEQSRIQAEKEAHLAEESRVRHAYEVRRRDEEEARLEAERKARARAEEDVRIRELEEARQHVEREARLRAEEEAQRRAEEEARLHAEEAERLRVAEELQRRAEEEAKYRAQEEERLLFEERQRLEAPLTEAITGFEDTDEPSLDLSAVMSSDDAWVDLQVEQEPVAAPLSQSVAVEQTNVPFESDSPAMSDDSDKGIDLIRAEKGIAPVGDESEVSAELLHLLNSESPNERATALAELAKLGGEDAFRFISRAFDDSSIDVRNAAARALYGLQADRAASFTRALREGSPERRRKIGASLATSGLATDAIANLTGESREKTYDAFSLLFLMAKAGEVQPLMKAIEDYPSVEVRLAVVKLLALSGQPEIVPAFRRLAVRGSLPSEVRSAVMEAIYQISSQGQETAPSAA